MRLEEIIIPVGMEKIKATKIGIKDTYFIATDYKIIGNNITYTTVRGDTFKRNIKTNEVYPLVFNKQYYLEF